MPKKVDYLSDGEDEFAEAIANAITKRAKTKVKEDEAKELIASMRASLQELNKPDEPDTDQT